VTKIFEPIFVTSQQGDAVAASEQVAGRAALVERAAKRWRRELQDLTFRNTLLFYKDRKRGTLDLADTSPGPLSQLLAGRTVRASQLFADPAAQKDAGQRLQMIYKKVKELQEERGIQAGYMAIGMATWSDDRTNATPASPVLLRPVALERRSVRDLDVKVTARPDLEINPSLLNYLAERFQVTIDGAELDALLPEPDALFNPNQLFGWLYKKLEAIPDFAIQSRMVIGTFSYAKLPMVKDVEEPLDLLIESDIIAALAGDRQAADALRSRMATVDVRQPDYTPPKDEYLILNADASQSRAINEVVMGNNLVIKGPPGTGKSQTIANLIATLSARGKRVLFVAEKRAAIDAVLRRLKDVGLDNLVLDIHDGGRDKRRIATAIKATLDAEALPTPSIGNQKILEGARSRLVQHTNTLHTPLPGWNVSVYDAQNLVLGTPESAQVKTRWSQQQLGQLTHERLQRSRECLREYAQLDGLVRPTPVSPWEGAQITTAVGAQQAQHTVHRLSNIVSATRQALDDLAAEGNFAAHSTVAEWNDLIRLLSSAAEFLTRFQPEVFDCDLDELIQSTADRRWRKRHKVTLTWPKRRRLIKRARTLARSGGISRMAAHEGLLEAQHLQNEWNRWLPHSAPPRILSPYPVAANLLGEMRELLKSLMSLLRPELRITHSVTFDDISKMTDNLTENDQRLWQLPTLHKLRTELIEHGLGTLLTECRDRELTADLAVSALEYAWHSSILAFVRLSAPSYSSFTSVVHDETAARFRDADRAHLTANAARIQGMIASRSLKVRQKQDAQAQFLRHQAGLQRRHRPIRELVQRASEPLMSLKPCWAMSPLAVSQVLPRQRFFDVVIFDEASQVPPADAIPSLIRAYQVVVAGDEHQLPPTAFFTSSTEDEELEDFYDEGGELVIPQDVDQESILDAMCQVAQVRQLTWHYRSRDDRLIAFSNAWIYDRSLTTFPGTASDSPLRHVLVDQHLGMPGQESSVNAEVNRVVELILIHAATNPDMSLGVIAMGREHANRVEAALQAALAGRATLETFFSESKSEPFFVKNLERVQGDERDTIILSMGYGKGPDGRMPHRFGPINMQGGERRLNVAVTRAKHNMIVVSSFASIDLDPNKLRAKGAKLLRAYLQYAESGGHDLGSGVTVPPQLNPFEIDVRDRLTAAGIPLIPQYGVGGYRIDFAAQHPERPGELVLAIEADGASYHSTETARDRDRIRQEVLESVGWRFHRIWSTAWFRAPGGEVAKTLTAYRDAVAAADAAWRESRTFESASEASQPFAANVPSSPSVPTEPKVHGLQRTTRKATGKRTAGNSSAKEAAASTPTRDTSPLVLTPNAFKRINDEITKVVGSLGEELHDVPADRASASAVRKNVEERRARLKDRLDELQDILARARFGKTAGNGTVTPGSVIRLRYEDGSESDVVISAVPTDNYDHVTPTSPLGRALYGYRAGEDCQFDTPRGRQRVRVVAVLD
jgi:transcription elongation GreA/GreB family factor/very-short-patch-repair endonuclease